MGIDKSKLMSLLSAPSAENGPARFKAVGEIFRADVLQRLAAAVEHRVNGGTAEIGGGAG
jgi:hypothetical protein